MTEINEGSVFYMFPSAMQSPHELWCLRLVFGAMPMTDVVPSSSTTDMLADESQWFAPSFCSRGHLPLVAAVDVMVLEDLRFPHGCMV